MGIKLIHILSLIKLIEITIGKKKDIFDETKIRNMKLKNRIFRGSVGDYRFFENGHITEEALKFYEKLSEGEIGTILTGYITVSDYDNFDNSNVFRIDKDEYIEEYKKLTSIVHKNNANIIMQLVHIGGNTFSNTNIIYAPSKIVNPENKKNNKRNDKR